MCVSSWVRGGACAVDLRFVTLVNDLELSASLLYIPRLCRTFEVCAHLDVDRLRVFAWYASQELIGASSFHRMFGGQSANQLSLISPLVCCISLQPVFFSSKTADLWNVPGHHVECFLPAQTFGKFTAPSFGDRGSSGLQSHEIADRETFPC